VEEFASVLSGRVSLWRVKDVRLWGRRTLLIFKRRWGRFRAGVIGHIGAGQYFVQLVRGGGVEEVAYACLALLFDDVGSELIGRIQEILGEGEGASIDATSAVF
jgi:hypothetical protein